MGFAKASAFAEVSSILRGLADVAHLTRVEGIKRVTFSRGSP